ncbi:MULTISPECIES: YjgB family protein [unclassified Bacillus (in: firmicutes)]|uniref:YjgB family protein n=1 Tax=unclassified Bacillus (in: firmicutes) TaxID=185979 RepID=UPI001BE88895|nr:MULTISPECIES: YjgB family protein [unclassified Bacillus (in: firmicutes)]MBT2613987.1 YjgB family protein [Bacillus sp. ISL-78]MBT2629502.1 YjgB family protein [Bacillus sp. ISL-101]
MLSKKPTARMVSAFILTGSLLGAGPSFSTEPVEAASTMDSASAIAKEDALTTLHEIYNKAFSGEMPYTAMGLKINENTQKEVYETFGSPPEPGNTDETFDYYHAEMGQPGFAFAYNDDKTISQIRYFGTNVERDHNLGSITPKVLGNQLGSADEIRHISSTNEINYIYKTGNYELQCIVGKNQTVDQINLLKAK